MITCPKHNRWIWLAHTPNGEQTRPCPECGLTLAQLLDARDKPPALPYPPRERKG